MTARKPDNRTANDSQEVPVYRIDCQQVEDAYQAFAATQRATRDNPALLENEYFTALQDTAYARFLAAFEAL